MVPEHGEGLLSIQDEGNGSRVAERRFGGDLGVEFLPVRVSPAQRSWGSSNTKGGLKLRRFDLISGVKSSPYKEQ